MSDKQLAIVWLTVSKLLDDPIVHGPSNGQRGCKFCAGSERGYWDSAYFAHDDDCPVLAYSALMEESRESR